MIVAFLSGPGGKKLPYRGFADRRRFTVEGSQYKFHKVMMIFQIE